MERTAVDSRAIAEIGYDANTETLEVLFCNGRTYQYYNFPAFMHQRLMEATSLGEFFNAEVKGQYAEARI